MRALRILLVIVVVLGGIFVVVDRVAVYFAESEAEGRVHVTGATIGSTDVSIKGFPFLTQLAGSRFDEVDVEITGIETDANGRRIRISRMNAALHEVKLADGYSGATAARATGTAVISYEDLTKAAGDGIVVEYGGNGKVKVTRHGRHPRPPCRAVCSPPSASSTATSSRCTPTRCRARASPGWRAWCAGRPTSSGRSAACPAA